MSVVGVDEAGRGPVFGSMFAAAICVETREHLPSGVDDSKRLTPERRQALAATLNEDERIHVGVAAVSVEQIDDPETDMNTLTVDAHARAIENAVAGLEFDAPPATICDACDTDAERFARRVSEACSIRTTVDARHRADDNDPLVGAASVVAKVERDAHVAALADAFGEIGSGYPSDPTTQAFLETYVSERGELPPFARRSWSTCERLLGTIAQTGLGDF